MATRDGLKKQTAAIVDQVEKSFSRGSLSAGWATPPRLPASLAGQAFGEYTMRQIGEISERSPHLNGQSEFLVLLMRRPRGLRSLRHPARAFRAPNMHFVTLVA